MSKNYSVQGLRGLFIVGVMLSHCFYLQNIEPMSEQFIRYISKLADVSFFFMAAGFFSVATFKNNGNFKSYFIKKIKKLYPLNALIVTLLFFTNLYKGTFSFCIEDITRYLANIFLVQTWIPVENIYAGIHHVSWFLSSLMFCYLSGYWFIKRIKENSSCAWPLVYFSAIILLIYKLFVAAQYPYGQGFGDYMTYLSPLIGLGDFMIGIILWKLSNIYLIGKKQFVILLLQLLAIFTIIFMFMSKQYISGGYNKAVYSVLFNAIMIYAFSIETKFSKQIFGNKIFVSLGNLSFEIYLLHVFVIGLGISLMNKISFFNQYETSVIYQYIVLISLIFITYILSYSYKYIYDKILNVFIVIGIK